MLVGNDITVDTRVKKTALALARVGLEVVLVGYTPEARRSESMLGPCRIVRVPVPWRLRDERRRRLARRRARRLQLGYVAPADEQAAHLRVAARDRDLVSSRLPSRVVRVLRFAVRGQRFVIRARQAAQRRQETYLPLAWKAWDRLLSRTGVGARWRRILPDIDDYELAFGRVIDELEPDVIHAHDVHMVGVATHAVQRARRRGRTVPWVYDAHEFVAGLSQYGGRTPRVIAAYLDLERRFVRRADRVVTVSDPLADELQRRYRLPRRPAVVMNIPTIGRAEPGAPTVRDVAGVDAGTPLLVYSGGVQHARGVQTAVEALTLLPDAHLAVVAVPHTRTHAVAALVKLADELGVGDRVHPVEPVASDAVSDFLATADVGLIPLLHFGSHEMALANKLFEYLHGGVPVVVSDCRAQADFVRRLDVGEVHRAEDARDLAAAVERVLADRDRFRRHIREHTELFDRYTWRRQEEVLWDLYRDLLSPDVVSSEPQELHLESLVESAVEPSRAREAGTVLGIGPANMAGQAWAWAKAVERHLPGVRTEVVAVEKPRLNFPADVRVAASTFARDTAWQQRQVEHVLGTWSHALLEAGRPVLGTAYGKTFAGDVDVLRGAGIRVGLLFHGSEIRDPRAHARRHRWSPFAEDTDLTRRLQEVVDQLAPAVRAFDGPKFVSTPDLLDDVPDARWLPVVVDPDASAPGEPPMTRPVPLVVHAPSNTALKGTALVEAALAGLVDSGAVEYRRLQDVPPDEVPALLTEADLVLDQFTIGSYGVLACQAMAAGRVTVGNVAPEVRDRVGGDLPIVQATPEDLETVLRGLLADRDAARAVAAEGPGFVRRFHDGRHSAGVLADFLEIQPAVVDATALHEDATR
ncbi:MAG: glycosyltransferase [Actinomycetes bacterium]